MVHSGESGSRRKKKAGKTYGYDWGPGLQYPLPSFGSKEKGLYRKIRQWVIREATRHGKADEPWFVLQSRSIAAVAVAESANALHAIGDLKKCYGIGDVKIRLYGDKIFELVIAYRLVR